MNVDPMNIYTVKSAPMAEQVAFLREFSQTFMPYMGTLRSAITYGGPKSIVRVSVTANDAELATAAALTIAYMDISRTQGSSRRRQLVQQFEQVCSGLDVAFEDIVRLQAYGYLIETMTQGDKGGGSVQD